MAAAALACPPRSAYPPPPFVPEVGADDCCNRVDAVMVEVAVDVAVRPPPPTLPLVPVVFPDEGAFNNGRYGSCSCCCGCLGVVTDTNGGVIANDDFTGKFCFCSSAIIIDDVVLLGS